jgi:hypothetical protein
MSSILHEKLGNNKHCISKHPLPKSSGPIETLGRTRKHVQKGYLIGKVAERAKIRAAKNVTRFTVSLILTYMST